MSGCFPIEMPVCRHLRPVKFGCPVCDPPVSVDLTELLERICALENRMVSIDHLLRSAETAETLFAQKVHDLKSIDQKRDDVINALCQKVEAISRKLDYWMQSRAYMKSEAQMSVDDPEYKEASKALNERLMGQLIDKL